MQSDRQRGARGRKSMKMDSEDREKQAGLENGSGEKTPEDLDKSRSFDFSVQNEFLNHLRKKQIPVEVALVTGIVFRGRIAMYDNFSLRLVFKGHSEIIYKSAIATMTPLPQPPSRRPFPQGGRERNDWNDRQGPRTRPR